MSGVCRDTPGDDRRLSAARRCGRGLIPFVAAAAGLVLLGVPAAPPVELRAQDGFDSEFDDPDKANRIPGAAKPDAIWETDEELVDVRIEGNRTIPASSIARLVKTRSGRVPIADQVRDDVRALYKTRWFFSVEPEYRRTDEGLVLLFKVRERPMLRNVEYQGNHKIKTKYLEALTGLKKGSAFSTAVNRDCCHRIEEYYREKGYPFATCTLIRGDEEDDREVVFEINEGKKCHVTKVNIHGNEYFWTNVLQTKVKTKTRKFWLFGGKYNPESPQDDIASLKEYYHNLGFFDVQIEHQAVFNEDKSQVTMDYTITEGQRYKVRKIEIAGNDVIKEQDLRAKFQTKPDEFFNASKLNKDVESVRDQYGERGRIFAQVQAVPRFLEQPGEVDLVYNIDEDRVYRIRRIEVVINGEYPHTRESVVLNRMLLAPGDLASAKKIQKSEARLRGSGFFDSNPINGGAPKINIRRVDEPIFPINEDGIEVVRGQSLPDEQAPAASPLFNNDPQGDPFGNALRDPPPVVQEPPGYIDIFPSVTETQTGRLMFGVGVNSDAGVIGSFVLDESNFDITRVPTSFDEVWNGTAFRGAGQQFRLEAVPGNQVSRYLVSWRDPYFLDTDYSLGLSGFYYTRIFNEWNETRGGGRVTVGRQITPFLSANMALRLEEVEVDNVVVPTPQLLREAEGNNFLSTVRTSIAHDTRDSAFLATEGHYLEFAYEQAFGEYNYPRFDLEGRQYFTAWQRADGEGRHIVSIKGQVQYTGEDTPIFERLYAGGFQSFRGFKFRGVTPRDLGTGIGGNFLAIGSVEYMFPLTADETLRAVAFSDFGSVEENVTLNNFRATMGAGLRITIPAMGPVPIALDFAWPIAKQEEDKERVFSFYVGFLR